MRETISQLVQDVMDGQEDPLRAFAILREAQVLIKKGITEIEDAAFIEAAKYGEKTFEHSDWKFTMKDGSKRFNFKGIDEWVDVESKKKAIESKYRSAFELSQKGFQPVTDDGELLELPSNIVTFSKSSISISKK